jgi:hypothetical protein
VSIQSLHTERAQPVCQRQRRRECSGEQGKPRTTQHHWQENAARDQRSSPSPHALHCQKSTSPAVISRTDDLATPGPAAERCRNLRAVRRDAAPATHPRLRIMDRRVNTAPARRPSSRVTVRRGLPCVGMTSAQFGCEGGRRRNADIFRQRRLDSVRRNSALGDLQPSFPCRVRPSGGDFSFGDTSKTFFTKASVNAAFTCGTASTGGPRSYACPRRQRMSGAAGQRAIRVGARGIVSHK